jgi:hypothetical protein
MVMRQTTELLSQLLQQQQQQQLCGASNICVTNVSLACQFGVKPVVKMLAAMRQEKGCRGELMVTGVS